MVGVPHCPLKPSLPTPGGVEMQDGPQNARALEELLCLLSLAKNDGEIDTIDYEALRAAQTVGYKGG